MNTESVQEDRMRDKVKCTIKVNINRINLMLRNNHKTNDIKVGYQISSCRFGFGKTC